MTDWAHQKTIKKLSPQTKVTNLSETPSPFPFFIR